MLKWFVSVSESYLPFQLPYDFGFGWHLATAYKVACSLATFTGSRAPDTKSKLLLEHFMHTKVCTTSFILTKPEKQRHHKREAHAVVSVKLSKEISQ